MIIWIHSKLLGSNDHGEIKKWGLGSSRWNSSRRWLVNVSHSSRSSWCCKLYMQSVYLYGSLWSWKSFNWSTTNQMQMEEKKRIFLETGKDLTSHEMSNSFHHSVSTNILINSFLSSRHFSSKRQLKLHLATRSMPRMHSWGSIINWCQCPIHMFYQC